MKKVILILMLIYSVCFSQGQYTSSWITEADSGSLQAMYVQSTGIDTSTYYNMKPYLTFKIQVCDTSSGGDSSAVKDMNQAGGSFRGIAIIGNTIIVANDTDKTLDYYNISDLSYISSDDISSIIIEGNILYGLWTKDEFR